MKLRSYQEAARAAVHQEWKENQSTLVELPTGGGKTRLASSIILDRQPSRSLFICHRAELVWQAAEHIKKVTSLTVGIEMGEYKTSGENLFGNSQVVVATVQTLCSGGDGMGRISKFSPDDFETVIADECHHSTSQSWRRVIEYFLTNPKCKLLGITATPDRADEESLGQLFQTVAYDYEILDAIRDGWLVPIEQMMVNVEELDLSSIRTTAGDLNGSDLEAVMLQEKPLHKIASSTIDIIGSKRGLGFASSVQHAMQLSEIFNRHRPGFSNFVCGKTDKEERKKIVSDFAAGKVQWLWNCGVFTEGFDDSGVEVIAMARPTKSRSLYAQMAGRSTRPLESIAHKLNDTSISALRRGMIARSVKPNCLILDFVGNSGRHKLMTTADILGGNVSDEAVQAAVNFAKHAGRPIKMADQLEEEEKKIQESKKRKLEDAARKVRLTAKSKYTTTTIDPFDILQIKPIAPKGWHKGKELSLKIKEILKNHMGINPDEIEYAQGMQLVKEQFRRWDLKLCTVKQAAKLKMKGYDVTDMTFENASKAFEELKNNGWHKPKNSVLDSISRSETVAVDSDDIPF